MTSAIKAFQKVTTSSSETKALAEFFAHQLQPGSVVFLIGQLGAGKTTFSQGLALGLGVQEQVISPTFVIAREYSGKLPLLHIDAYRLASAGIEGDALMAELEVTGLGDFSDGITLIEWGQSIAHFFEKRHEVRLNLPTEEDGEQAREAIGKTTEIEVGSQADDLPNKDLTDKGVRAIEVMQFG